MRTMRRMRGMRTMRRAIEMLVVKTAWILSFILSSLRGKVGHDDEDEKDEDDEGDGD